MVDHPRENGSWRPTFIPPLRPLSPLAHAHWASTQSRSAPSNRVRLCINSAKLLMFCDRTLTALLTVAAVIPSAVEGRRPNKIEERRPSMIVGRWPHSHAPAFPTFPRPTSPHRCSAHGGLSPAPSPARRPAAISAGPIRPPPTRGTRSPPRCPPASERRHGARGCRRAAAPRQSLARAAVPPPAAGLTQAGCARPGGPPRRTKS